MAGIDETKTRWSLAARCGFLSLALLLAAYAAPEILGSIPFVDEWATGASLALWSALMPGLGAALGIDGPIFVGMTGSSDMTWRWVQLLVIAVFSLVGGVLWAVIDRRRSDYRELHAWLRILVRHALALAMFIYGVSKLVDLQFGPVSPIELTRTYGESSPMGLAWTFMNYSRPYRCFGGLAEVIGALLLLSRRTTTLGGLVIVAVMANVVALNFCYDIAAKIYSSILLIMAIFLITPDAARMIDMFVYNRPVVPAELDRPRIGPRMQAVRRVGKLAFAGFLVVLTALYMYLAGVFEVAKPMPPLYGLYEVEVFALDGAERPPLITDDRRWRQVFFGRDGRAMLQSMTGVRTFVDLVYDETTGTLTLSSGADEPRFHAELAARWVAPDRLDLAGESLRASLRAIDPDDFPLLQRRFHWINERSFNR